MNEMILITQSKRYQQRKKEKLDKLKRLREIKKLETARDYLILANSVFGEERIQSRRRIIMKMRKFIRK